MLAAIGTKIEGFNRCRSNHAFGNTPKILAAYITFIALEADWSASGSHPLGACSCCLAEKIDGIFSQTNGMEIYPLSTPAGA
jgi:hypothetical protein